jgi:hypothetical protein
MPSFGEAAGDVDFSVQRGDGGVIGASRYGRKRGPRICRRIVDFVDPGIIDDGVLAVLHLECVAADDINLAVNNRGLNF